MKKKKVVTSKQIESNPIEEEKIKDSNFLAFLGIAITCVVFMIFALTNEQLNSKIKDIVKDLGEVKDKIEVTIKNLDDFRLDYDSKVEEVEKMKTQIVKLQKNQNYLIHRKNLNEAKIKALESKTEAQSCQIKVLRKELCE